MFPLKGSLPSPDRWRVCRDQDHIRNWHWVKKMGYKIVGIKIKKRYCTIYAVHFKSILEGYILVKMV